MHWIELCAISLMQMHHSFLHIPLLLVALSPFGILMTCMVRFQIFWRELMRTITGQRAPLLCLFLSLFDSFNTHHLDSPPFTCDAINRTLR